MDVQREHFWNAIIWPVLWPLLLVQVALLLLCMAVGLFIWGGVLSPFSWSPIAWLNLAFLLGSGMNAGVFLMLIKARAKHKDARFMQQLAELERHTRELYTDSLAPACATDNARRPLQRLSNVNAIVAQWSRRQAAPRLPDTFADQGQTKQVPLDEWHQQQHQLKRLKTGQERAQEALRLKTGYWNLLQGEVDSLIANADSMLKAADSDQGREHVTQMYEQLVELRLLVVNLVEQDAYEAAYNEPSPETGKRPLRVLVVDDGPVNLMLTRQLLEAQGLQVEGVTSGERALECQQSLFYDVVFMDIFMPTLDGFETARRWRNAEHAHGNQRSILIALTANVDNAGRDACTGAGMDDLLSKPYQPETLLSMIAKWAPISRERSAP